MPTGKIKWFDPEKGFGFIRPADGGSDVFVHVTAVHAAGLSDLQPGQKVSYEVELNRGKLAATRLRVE
jgi:cold shock protein